MENENDFLPIITASALPGQRVSEVLGLVWGSDIRARSIFKDIIAMFRFLGGGEIKEYASLFDEVRHNAIEKLRRNAQLVGADAIIDVRFVSSVVVPGGVEFLVYGTAVRLEKAK